MTRLIAALAATAAVATVTAASAAALTAPLVAPAAKSISCGQFLIHIGTPRQAVSIKYSATRLRCPKAAPIARQAAWGTTHGNVKHSGHPGYYTLAHDPGWRCEFTLDGSACTRGAEKVVLVAD